jgi:1,4-alpha-glucan branching enzyme
MPVSNVSLEVDWGYLPIGYFGVDERFGRRDDFQRFVDASHQHGLAVVADVVYGHASADFPYATSTRGSSMTKILSWARLPRTISASAPISTVP